MFLTFLFHKLKIEWNIFVLQFENEKNADKEVELEIADAPAGFSVQKINNQVAILTAKTTNLEPGVKVVEVFKKGTAEKSTSVNISVLINDVADQVFK